MATVVTGKQITIRCPASLPTGPNGVEMLLPKADWDALMIGLVQQKYQLILGAGASAEAKDRRGNRVMAGAALTEALIRDFNLPRPKDLSLRRVYAAAEGRKSLTGIDLCTYLRDLYTGCQAPDWYRYLVAIPWKYIWTLNIDDVLEHAYRQAYEANAVNTLVSVSWTEHHKIPRPDEVIAVHLHGKANRARNPGELIFDISTYLMATNVSHRWHSIFADAYSDAPTIVLGAALREELDLHTVLERGRLTAKEAPSIIVLKELDEFDRDEYQRWGLIAIEATAEELLKTIADEWPDYALRYAPDKAEAAEQISPRQLSFLNQWDRLAPPQARLADPRHDFYAGHEPTYNDILANLDFERRGFSTLRDTFLEERSRQLVGCIYGPTFSGKTCLALQLCRAVAELGWTVYSFDPELRPDLDAILWWVRRSPRTVLYIEGIADFASDIRDLMQRCTTDGLFLRALVVERETRMKEVRRFLAGDMMYEWHTSSHLNKNEVNRLLVALKNHARLGVITGLPIADQRKYFSSTHKGELLSSFSGLEGGEGFLERIHRRLSDVGTGNARTVTHLTAIVSSIGYGLPFGIAMSAAGISPGELTRILDTDSFADIIEVRRSRLYPRHRVFGSYLLDHEFKRQENFIVTNSLAKHLAPHLSPAAIGTKTLHYRLARQLLDWELLARWLGADRLLEWYASIQDLYDWNSRYWEQRALAASHQGLHERAASWARRGIAEHRDALALNTLATVIMRRAIEITHDYEAQMSFYQEAVAFLDEAQAIAAEDSEYPYVTFFRYTIELARRQRRNGPIDGRLKQRWNDWWYSAQHAPVFQGPAGGQSMLQGFRRDWLRLSI